MNTLIFKMSLAGVLAVMLSACGQTVKWRSAGAAGQVSAAGSKGAVRFDPQWIKAVTVSYVSEPGGSDSVYRAMDLFPDHAKQQLKFTMREYDGSQGKVVSCEIAYGNSISSASTYELYRQAVSALALVKSEPLEYGASSGDTYIYLLDTGNNPVQYPVNGSGSLPAGKVSFGDADLLLELFDLFRQHCVP